MQLLGCSSGAYLASTFAIAAWFLNRNYKTRNQSCNQNCKVFISSYNCGLQSDDDTQFVPDCGA